MYAQRILMVEDDKEQAALFHEALQFFGYEVEVAEDARQAREQLSSSPYGILLADWDLPGDMQGDQLIEWTRQNHPRIKSILFSNHPRVEEMAERCGANRHFRKIEGLNKLHHLINNLLKGDSEASPLP